MTHEKRGQHIRERARELRTMGAINLRDRAWLMCAGSLCCMLLYTSLLNDTVFPLFYGVFLGARDVSSAAAVVCALALYAISAHRPDLFEPRRAFSISLILVAAALPLTFLAVMLTSPILLVLASLMRMLGTVWFALMTTLAFADLVSKHGTDAALSCACVGWLASALLGLILSVCPFAVRVGTFCVAIFASPALAWQGSRYVIESAIAAGPAANLRVTYPRSFVSPAHTVFITLILLKMSFGFAMTFASSQAAPLATQLAWIPTLVILIAVLALNGRLDSLYRATLLCVLAGFLLVNPLIEGVTGMPGLANTMLRAGSDLARILMLLFAALVGSRNSAGAIGAALFVSAANSFGSLLGAQLGIAANAVLVSDQGLFALLLAAITFIFVAYNILNPQSFAFDETADAIENMPAPHIVELPVDTVQKACEQLASEHGLTPREAEALLLLAHGHNTQSIQEHMTVSRSTAKTHVRNVYAKLNVHSQQELIDLVEDTQPHGEQ